MSEQLEFDLWVERRFTAIEMIRAEIHSSEFNYLRNTRECQVYMSPMDMHTIVRYRV